MPRSYTYVCPECGVTAEREYRVPSIIQRCVDDCAFGHHVRADIVEKVATVPAAARPDDWASRSATERVLVALEEGAVDLSDLR